MTMAPASYDEQHNTEAWWHEQLARRAPALARDERVSLMVGSLWQLCRGEGTEARDPWLALEMVAWDSGYQGARLQPWFLELARKLRVNVQKEWEKGLAEGKGRTAHRRRSPGTGTQRHALTEAAPPSYGRGRRLSPVVRRAS